MHFMLSTELGDEDDGICLTHVLSPISFVMWAI